MKGTTDAKRRVVTRTSAAQGPKPASSHPEVQPGVRKRSTAVRSRGDKAYRTVGVTSNNPNRSSARTRRTVAEAVHPTESILDQVPGRKFNESNFEPELRQLLKKYEYAGVMYNIKMPVEPNFNVRELTIANGPDDGIAIVQNSFLRTDYGRPTSKASTKSSSHGTLLWLWLITILLALLIGYVFHG
jgi:hypothetical protein